ncbi:MCE family protein [Ramlibacter sp. USB13]|uniref:MCE family protein n=1 Tax=Ramlibacter cellulosilyticus TaxID=2764187 RepID=A0A923MWI0_9BURK|nr:MlaD family protein [Ramlibacter cellulosilyticus]MBC5785032.1 MCE family protein [Ramlibacter cellulosilyticus]
MDASAKARWLFLALLLGGTAAVAAWMSFGPARYNTYELRTADAVSGLIAGAPVEFHGVEVGKVAEVRLLAPRMVQVLVQVNHDVPVTTATVATIIGRGVATRGFTGYMVVSLEEGPGPGAALVAQPGHPHPQLATAPSRVVSLDTSIAELNTSVRAVNGLLQSTLDAPTIASLKQAVAGLESVTHTLAANNERMERILANAERATARLDARVLPQAEGALARMERLATTVDGRIVPVLQNAEQASTRLEPLLQASHDAAIVLQTQVLPQAQRTLVRMDQLSATLTDTAGRIQRNPSLLVRGPGPLPGGPGE